MRCWCGYLSGATCSVCIWSSWCHWHPQTPSSLASFKSRLVLPFWYRLTRVVVEKMPLNGCRSSSSSCWLNEWLQTMHHCVCRASNVSRSVLSPVCSNLNRFTIFFTGRFLSKFGYMDIKNPTAPCTCCYTTFLPPPHYISPWSVMDVDKWLDRQCDQIKVGPLSFVLCYNSFAFLFYR